MGTIGLPSSIPNKYFGPPVNLIPIRTMTHQPTTIDKKFPVGQFVILSKDPTTGVEGELWYLSKFQNGDPVWVQFSITPGSPGIDTITTDDGAPAVEPDVNGNVNFVGGLGVITSGQSPGSTVTIEIDPSVITTSYTGNTGSATPTLGVLQIVGSDPISTSASGNSVTINCATANNAETIAGAISNKVVVPSGLNAKIGTQTSGGVAYGQGSTSALGYTSAGSANAVLIGGASPSFSTSATSYFGGISFDSGSNVLRRFDNITLFTPFIYGSSSAGTATYSSQYGAYSRIGNIVFVQVNLVWTGHTGTGDMMVGGFPFIFAAAASFYPMATMVQDIVLPAGALSVCVDGVNATTTAEVACSVDNGPIANIQMDAAGAVLFTGAYLTDP